MEKSKKGGEEALKCKSRQRRTPTPEITRENLDKRLDFPEEEQRP